MTAEQLKTLFPRHPQSFIDRNADKDSLVPPLKASIAKEKSKRKPLLNGLETRAKMELVRRGYHNIMEQAITLRLDPPFKSYRPDLAYTFDVLTFVEVKGPHRFRRAGIAKVALAAKTYPMFRFILLEWLDGKWKETTL